MAATTSAELLTLADAAAALRDGTVTSAELLATATARADALDAQLGVYLHRFDEEAPGWAAQADADFAAGIDRGPLQGIPVGVKDILAMSDGPTTAQSTVLDPAWGAGRDAIVVERLKAAGAVITGKTSTMEFASGLPDPDQPFPLPRNPWDPTTWTGGSSSGTGAGVAAGMMLAGIGTDTGGSIRIPAIFCGVSGLMPTFGRVPNAGCAPLGYSLDHIGPLARSARDCALMLSTYMGGDPRDPYAVDLPVPDLLARADGSLEGLRIGVERVSHFGVIDDEDPAVAPAFEAAVAALEALGATVVEVTLPLVAETSTAAMITCAAESLAYHRNDLQRRGGEYARSNRSMYALGALFSGADYVQAQRLRRVTQRRLAAIFAGVDAIVMPAATRVAPSYDALLSGDVMEVLAGVHTMYWDAVGNPALVVPMGFNADGLPLSLQIAGRPFEEDVLVQVGDAFQQTSDWHLRVPPLAAGVLPAGV
jgi:aspartyl-tRNA(Asn)/glutamyl-tRNA(Gln) amidotransferase subunit A